MAQSGATATAKRTPPPLKWGDKSSLRAASWSQRRLHAKWPRRRRAQASTSKSQHQLKAPLSDHSISRLQQPDPWRNNKPAARIQANNNGTSEMSKTDDDDVSRELVVPDQVHSSRFTWPQLANGMPRGLELAQVAARPESSCILEATRADTFGRPAKRTSGPNLGVEPIPKAGSEPDRDIPPGQSEGAGQQIDRRGPKRGSGSEATMSSSAIILTAASSARRPEPDLSAPPQTLGQPKVVASIGAESGAEEPICMDQNFRETFKPATRTTAAATVTTTTTTTTTTIRHEQFNNKPAYFKPVRMLVPMLAFCLLLCPQWPARANSELTASAAASTNDPRNQNHLELWRSILARLYSAAPDQRAAIDKLAGKLAASPDRSQAALFYVDQLARRLDEERMATTGRDGLGSRSSAVCSSVSLAALMQPRPLGASDTPTPEIDPDDRDDLSRGHVWPNSMAKHLQAAVGGQLAHPAISVSNLLTRLLSMDDENGHDINDNNNNKRHRAETNATDQRRVRHSLEQIGITLKRMVEPKFFDHTLEHTLREFLVTASSFKSPEMTRIIHSIGLVLFAGDVGSERGLRLAYSKVALILSNTQTKLIDLLSKDESGRLADGRAPYNQTMPSYILKWFKEAGKVESELVASAAERFVAPQRNHSQGQTGDGNQWQTPFGMSDGVWFAPHVQCDLSTRWLITYSLPFFALKPGQTHQVGSSRMFELRGVSYVNLDLASLGPLISPCAAANNNNNNNNTDDNQLGTTTKQTPSFLAGTSKCHLIGSSQGNNLDELLLSNPAGLDNDDNFASGAAHFGLADRSRIAKLLAKRNARQKLGLAGRKLNEETAPVTSKSFVLGVDLEIEAALTMLTGAVPLSGDEDEILAGNNRSNGQAASFELQARRYCKACRKTAGNESSGPETFGDQDDDLEDDLGCQLDGRSDISRSIARKELLVRFIRPLVLICQVVCIVATLALIGVILRIRKSRTIIVSGWMMLETMLVGALLLHVSVLVRYFQATSLTCLLRPWLRELGFSVFYGSILIKLYRMLTEFQTRKAHRVCMRDKDQIVYLLAIVLIVIGYMSAWTALMVDSFFVQQVPENLVELTGGSDNIESMMPIWTQAGAAGQLALEQRGDKIEGLDTEFELRLASDVDKRRKRAPELLASTHENNDQLAEARDDDDGGSSSNYNNKDNQPGGTSEIRLESGNRFVNLAFGRQELDRPQRDASAGGDEGERRRARHLVTSSDVVQTSSGTAGGDGSLLDGNFEVLAQGLDSFGQLFLGLLETEQRFDLERDTFVYLVRCRKLTWDYVTESGEIALLLFGLHLVYKLRNASIEVNKEKLILGFGLLIELITSSLVYLIRHSLWHKLTSDHLLALDALRCQLSVTLTVVLVFGPKLRDIGRSKPALLVSAMFGRWASEFLLENCACDFLRPAASGGATTSGCSSAGGGGATGTAGAGQPGACGKQRGVSVRHRCHISCEEHDHHLNDATRLHQAMLSNSALEIGSINLADMDPDEIQAELKRVYTQLELLKTKVMRRDNPHISKRRGGRKPGHRKFSLQAFHGRHSSTTAAAAASDSPNNGQPVQQQQQPATRANCDTAASQVNAVAGLSDDSESPSGSKQQQQHNSSKRLPAVTELDGESSPAPFGIKGEGNQEERLPTYMHTIKHVRLDEPRPSQETTHTKYTQSTRQTNAPNAARSGKLSFSILAKRSHSSGNGPASGNSNNHCNTNATTASDGHSTAKWTPELPSTSSLGYDEDALMNDSQSSGEMTPQRRSSIIYNHQS